MIPGQWLLPFDIAISCGRVDQKQFKSYFVALSTLENELLAAHVEYTYSPEYSVDK